MGIAVQRRVPRSKVPYDSYLLYLSLNGRLFITVITAPSGIVSIGSMLLDAVDSMRAHAHAGVYTSSRQGAGPFLQLAAIRIVFLQIGR